MISPNECIQTLEKNLGKHRRQHSLAVAEQAVRLAKRYGVDPDRARIAGLLHDVVKDFPKETMREMLTDWQVPIDDVTARSPQLWHAVLGAVYAERVLSVQDEEILSAIRYHTTGKAGMTIFEKVIYVADYTSDDRDYPDAPKMRKIADADLDAALREALRYTLQKLAGQRLPVHPDSVSAYNMYVIPDPPPALRLK